MDEYTGNMYSFCDNNDGDNILFFNFEEWAKDPKKFSKHFFEDVKKQFENEDVDNDDENKCEIYTIYICKDTESFDEQEEKGAIYTKDFSFFFFAGFLEWISTEEAIIKSADVMRKIIKAYLEKFEHFFRVFYNLKRLERAMKLGDNFTSIDEEYRDAVGRNMSRQLVLYENDVICKLKEDKY